MQEDDRSDGSLRAAASDTAASRSGTNVEESASRGRLRSLLILVAGLGLGFVIALLLLGRGPAASSGAVDDAVRSAVTAAPSVAADPPDGDDAVASSPDAASGRAAVEGFVAAEIAGDLSRSFSFLSGADREEFATAAGWESAHADLLPQITGFEPAGVTTGDDGVEVTGTLMLEPALDEVVGLVPATADVTWVAVEDASGRWGVDLGASSFEPRYPPEAGAQDAALEWARARQRCERAAEYDEGLVGTTGPADRLCDAAGDIDVGTAQRLDDLDAPPFQAAFGDDVTTWARVVDVTGPVDLRVVLAPIGDDWLVIGALPA
ncbi:hypothetical protein BH23ACT10_BH23ACT10_05740 [soil metagenome]